MAAPTRRRLALLAIGLLALAAYLFFPTYPTYDSMYALLWGRDLLHAQLPNLHVYRAPTEHPLAIAFGALCSLFGQSGARLLVLGSVASFVALAAGSYRLARLCFGPVVAAVAGALVLSRFFVENLALQGYLDVTYAALVVWAAALEAQRPRRGWPVLGLLCAAGLLRPEAWLLSGAYSLWCYRPKRARVRLAGLALAALAPALWLGVDALLTGDPLYSLRSTSGLAAQLGRTQGLTGVLSSTWTYAVRIDKLPVVLGAIAGALAALRLAPRRALVPLALLAGSLAAFVGEGAAGAPVLDRYMVAPAIVMALFCGVALGGWFLLDGNGPVRSSSPADRRNFADRGSFARRGGLVHPSSFVRRRSFARRAWVAAAAALLLYGLVQVNSTLTFEGLRDTLAYHEQLDEGLQAALRSPAVRRSLERCRLLSLPNNKLVPDALWLLADGARVEVIARSQARELAERGVLQLQRRLQARSVAVYPLTVTHFFNAVAGIGEEPGVRHPPAGFRRIYASHTYVVYANC